MFGIVRTKTCSDFQDKKFSGLSGQKSVRIVKTKKCSDCYLDSDIVLRKWFEVFVFDDVNELKEWANDIGYKKAFELSGQKSVRDCQDKKVFGLLS